MEKLYFEVHGSDILKLKGITKTAFSEMMGIKKQNVNILFQTKNILTLRKAAKVLDVPFELLISNADEPDIEINGYIEINGKMVKVKDRSDILNLLSEIPESDDSSFKGN